MRKIFLSALIFTLSFAAFAKADLAEVRCSVELQSEGILGPMIQRKELVKTVKIRKALFNENKQSVKIAEIVEFDRSYSVKVELKETLNVELGSSLLEVQGTLLRHRVGNGKIVLGENFQSFDSESFRFSNNINIAVMNDYFNITNESSVVKGAFIECSTL